MTKNRTKSVPRNAVTLSWVEVETLRVSLAHARGHVDTMAGLCIVVLALLDSGKTIEALDPALRAMAMAIGDQGDAVRSSINATIDYLEDRAEGA